MLYHGTSNRFDHFDLSFKGEGESASLLIGHGVYLAEKPGLANLYRERLSDPRYNGTQVSYWDENSNEYTPQERNELIEAGEMAPDDFQALYGNLLEVGGVDTDTLIVWDGTADDQPFDVLETIKALRYSEEDLEALDAFMEEAEEAEDVSMQYDIEEVVEKVMLYGASSVEIADLMCDVSREDVNWQELERIIGDKALGLDEGDDGAGSVFYGMVVGTFDGDEAKAAEWLSSQGIHGVMANLELPITGHLPEGTDIGRTVVYWNTDDLTIARRFSPSEIEQVALAGPSLDLDSDDWGYQADGPGM